MYLLSVLEVGRHFVRIAYWKLSFIAGSVDVAYFVKTAYQCLLQVCCFDSPWFNKKIQFITGYAVLIAPGLIQIQFITGYAVLIAPGLIQIQFITGYDFTTPLAKNNISKTSVNISCDCTRHAIR